MGVHHVTSRGVDGRNVFVDIETYELCLRLIGKAVRRHAIKCHAFCLMTNHFHLVLETFVEGQLAAVMQFLNSAYARNFNEIVGRRGYLFERPFRSVLIDKERHALEVSRYVVLNPVRARMVASATAYRWSSLLATLALAPRPAFLSTDWTLGNFDHDEQRAQVKFASFVAEGVNLPRPAVLR
jgi:REP element-mobilizing transposase RayT